MDILNEFEVMPNNSGDNGNSGQETFFKEKHRFGNLDVEDLFFSLKCHIDSQQKLIQLYRTRIRSFERFRKYCQRLAQFDDNGGQIEFNMEQFQNEYHKFDRNYRYFWKRIRNLRKQTKSTLSNQNQNVYDILYNLAAKLESNDNFKAQYFSGDQIYPEVTINEVIESTESANYSTVNNCGNTQGNSIPCDFNDFSSVHRRARFIQSHYNNSDTIQINPEISLNIVEEQQLELTTNYSIENDPVNNDGDDFNVEPHKQIAKPRKKASKVQSLRETYLKNNKLIKAKCALKKIKQEIFTDSFRDSNSSLQKKKAKTKWKPEIATTPKVFLCDVDGCQYFTIYSCNLNKHKVKHSDARPFNCDKCNVAFKTKGDLKVHQNIHEGRRFSCTFEDCTANYSTKQNLSKHIKIFHTKEAPLLRCSWDGCDFVTCRSEDLKFHQIVHTGERPFKCPDCEMSFKARANLCSHKRTHQNERRFKCDFEGCDFASYSKELLQNHQSVHNVDRLFNCDWPGCGMSFKSPSGIWSHKLLHENQPRFRCKWEGCEFETNLSGGLRDHVETVHQNKKNKPISRIQNCPVSAPTLSETNNSWESKTNSAIEAIAGEMINCFGGQSINHTGHGHGHTNNQPPTTNRGAS